jgi:hypothetical protein
MSGIEYLYWYEGSERKHFVGNYNQTRAMCRNSGAERHYCYGTGYGWDSPWYLLDGAYSTNGDIPASDVPPDIRALHLLIYRGDYE